ncbi:MAG: hypothetical protein AB7Q27_02635, partial [Acidimicrobiia bacterium]
SRSMTSSVSNPLKRIACVSRCSPVVDRALRDAGRHVVRTSRTAHHVTAMQVDAAWKVGQVKCRRAHRRTFSAARPPRPRLRDKLFFMSKVSSARWPHIGHVAT